MKILTGALLPCLFGAGSVFAATSLSSVLRVTSDSSHVVPNRFIVEITSASGKRSLTSPHQDLYHSLQAQSVAFKVDMEFDASPIFVGASVTLSDAQDVAKLQAMPGVVAIRQVKIIAAPKPVKLQVLSGPDDPSLPPDIESSHIMTGVDKLHAQGFIGAGVKIAIIDSGIDYTHPLLGAGFGPGYKVAGGTDLVRDDFNGTNGPVPDPDPLDQCFGHGTHVAGIIGANPGNEFNISGVAYGATLSAYRIFGCSPNSSTTDDLIVQALLLGVSDGHDILTLSLGGSDGWTESTSSVVASKIAASGKIVTIAAGNDGKSGAWYTSQPGNGIDVISVGSVDKYVSATVNGVAHDPIAYYMLNPFNVTGALPVFATSTNTTVPDDACNPLPDSTPDLSPFLVIVRRGTCTFVQKLTNVAAKGGKVSFIYNNRNGLETIEAANFTTALISPADGEFLVSQFVAKVNISITFPQAGAIVQINDIHGGLMSNFSSHGPTNDLFFKPAVAAPGGNIPSTFPVPLGSFALLSGTSMATPFVAGCAALLLSVKGKSSVVAKGARALFETTAQRVPSSHTDGDSLQTLTQAGAGLVNVFNAVHTTTIVLPGEFLLNDTAHFQGVHSFTVQNTGYTAQTFTLSHVPAGTAVTVSPGSISVADGPVPLSNQFATVEFSETTFTVNPGQTHELVAVISPPADVDTETFSVYSGFVQIKSDTESLQISYLGLAASLKDKQVVDNTDKFFGMKIPTILDPAGKVQTVTRNYTFVGDDFPTLLYRLVFGTPLLRVDLVDPNFKIATTLNTRDSAADSSFSHRDDYFAEVPIIGALVEVDFTPRNSDDPDTAHEAQFNTFSLTNATFANGTQISNGSYRWLLRALKVTGDPMNEEDFESYLSPIIGIDVGN